MIVEALVRSRHYPSRTLDAAKRVGDEADDLVEVMAYLDERNLTDALYDGLCELDHDEADELLTEMEPR